MTTIDLLAHCRVLGINLAPGSDGALLWEADAHPPPELLEHLAVSKATVLAILRETAPHWDAVEAERLLAELRAEVARVEWEDYRGQVPAPLLSLLRDAVTIGTRYVREHASEAARGWDALALLADLRPIVRECAENWRRMHGAANRPVSRARSSNCAARE